MKVYPPNIQPECLNTYLAAFLQIAMAEMNTKEIAGKNHNPRILQYHKSTNNRGAVTDEISWCASFVNWVVGKSGLLGTDSTLARSWQHYGQELLKPVPGAIAVFSRGPDKSKGHVAFYLYETKKSVVVLGGNQGDKVSMIPYDKSKLLGYRMPDFIRSIN